MDDLQALADTRAMLERTPRVVRELLTPLPAAWSPPKIPNEWTPRDVVGHLISGELDDWIPRAEIILGEGTARPFTPFDRTAHEARDRGESLALLVERFATLRNHNLARLEELVSADSDLNREGSHPEFGVVTLRQLLAAWVVHDLDHLAQITEQLAITHDGAVGPWKPYLGILMQADQG